jgi:hypothetical protein
VTNDQVARAVRTSRVLWGALMASMIVYAAIATVISKQNAPKPLLQPLLIALAATSIVELAIGFVLRAKMMPSRRKSEAVHPNIGAAFARMRAAEITGWAFCEAVAINGLILTMLTFEPVYSYAFTAVGALGMIAIAPNARVAQAVYDANQP